MDSLSDKSPLFDRTATGGLHAWEAFSAQVRYALTKLPSWLLDDDFYAFQLERLEDIDVIYRPVGSEYIVYHQLKRTATSPHDVQDIIAKAIPLYGHEARDRLTIASSRFTPPVLTAFTQVRLFRDTYYKATGSQSMAAARTQVSESLVAVGVAANSAAADFVIDRVDIDPAPALEATDASATAAGGLGHVPAYAGKTLDRLLSGIAALGAQLEQRKRYRWTRAEVCAVIDSAIRRYEAGPAVQSGDIVLLCHTSRAPVRIHPSLDDLPAAMQGRRVLGYCADYSGLTLLSSTDIAQVLTSMDATEGEFMMALEQAKRHPVAYYGFPHVPLAARAGFRLGEQAQTVLIEHDRVSGRYAWPTDGDQSNDLALAVSSSGPAHGRRTLTLRISVSFPVLPAQCRFAAPVTAVQELAFSVARPRRGILRSDSQVRHYTDVIRQAVDPLVGDVDAIHMFAAVPVSMALLIGQVASAVVFPRTFVYNFDPGPPPGYSWALCLQDSTVHFL